MTTLTEDLAGDIVDFFEGSGFEVSVTKPDSSVVYGLVFDSRNVDIGIENSDVQLRIPFSNVSDLAQGSVVVIGGATYYLMQTPISDMTGLCSIPLSKSRMEAL